MEVQAGISCAKLKSKIGTTQKILVDAPGIGRSSADAPEIDGLVYFEKTLEVTTGQFVDVRIERSDEHYLHGRLA